MSYTYGPRVAKYKLTVKVGFFCFFLSMSYMDYSKQRRCNSYRLRHLIHPEYTWVRFRLMVLNATFNNILVKSWRSVLLVEESGVPAENHRPVESH